MCEVIASLTSGRDKLLVAHWFNGTEA